MHTLLQTFSAVAYGLTLWAEVILSPRKIAQIRPGIGGCITRSHIRQTDRHTHTHTHTHTNKHIYNSMKIYSLFANI